MPPLSRLLIRAAFLWMAASPLLAWATSSGARFSPTAIHALLIGGFTQMIMGVAYWMFPLPRLVRKRGHEGKGIAAFILLNCALLLRCVAEPSLLVRLFIWSAALQTLALLIFVYILWARVRGATRNAAD